MQRADRLTRRLEHLDALMEGRRPAFTTATKAIELWVEHGKAIPDVRVRAAFIEGDVSKGKTPPLSQLISARGHGLRTALLALLLAQTKKGSPRHLLKLPLTADQHDEVAWSDLIVSSAQDGAGSYSRRVPQKRASSARQALTRLSRTDISLVEPPSTLKRVGRFDEVRLLQDSGPRAIGAPVAYSLPTPKEPVLKVPLDFFTNGWIFVLEDTEIATYLMYRYLCTHGGLAHISAAERENTFGIKTSAWEQYWVLVDSGILDVHADPNRRPDGTVVEQSRGQRVLPHRFSLADKGLQSNALLQVWRAVDNRTKAA